MTEQDSVICVRLTPNAKKNEIVGWTTHAEKEVLKAHVTAVPEKGKANQALIKLLSKTYKIPKSFICIIRGETSRTKTVRLHGIAPDDLFPIQSGQ